MTSVRLTFDFEERLLGTVASVPVISSLISILGLSQDLRLEIVQKFPSAKVRKGRVEIGEDINNNNNNNADEDERHQELSVIMKSVASVLSWIRGKEFSIVGSTVDSSAFSGYVTKTYCWTMQK